MTPIEVFLAILIILMISDMAFKIIPNWIVIPGIVTGCLMTGHWFYALMMLGVGMLLFKHGYWRGGDGKLLAMIGAFFGFYALTIFLLWIALAFWYGCWKDLKIGIPMAPFAFLASLPFIALGF